MRTPLQVPAIYCDIVEEDAWDALWDASNPDHEIVDLNFYDDPTRIHTLRKYLGQAEDSVGVDTVRAKQ